MKNIIKIAFRNLKRSSRRTLLTAALITIGVIFVLVYSALSSSFKAYMVGEITDSMMGHIQIHKKGYIASVDNLPLDKNLNQKQVEKILEGLDNNPYVESYTFRIKLGGMFSNYVSSTNIRLNAIDPENERTTLPLLKKELWTVNLTFSNKVKCLSLNFSPRVWVSKKVTLLSWLSIINKVLSMDSISKWWAS